jgi:hypothetical protein
VDIKPALVVPRSEHSDGIAGDRGWSWALGQRPAVWLTKSQLAAGLSLDLVALLVDGAMMTTTEEGEIRERGGASVSPVADVMTLAEP